MSRISTIVPALNEGGTIHELISRVNATYLTNKYHGEIIVVSNGSTDHTPSLLEQSVEHHNGIFVDETNMTTVCPPHHSLNNLSSPFIVGLRHDQKHKSKAIARALAYATGDYIVLLDSDLQYDPTEIPKLVQCLDGGAMIANGRRRTRQDPIWRLAIPTLGHVLFNTVYGTVFKDINSGFKAVRREVFDMVGFERVASQYYGLHRFLIPLAVWAGLPVEEVDVSHHPRRYGKSSISLVRTSYEIASDFIALRREREEDVEQPSSLFSNTLESEIRS